MPGTLLWVLFGLASAGSQIWLCRKIEARPTIIGLICFSVAFHFWPVWYWFKYRPAKRDYELRKYIERYPQDWLSRERRRIGQIA